MTVETALPVTVSSRAAKRIAEIIAAEGRAHDAAPGGDRRRLFGLSVQFRARTTRAPTTTWPVRKRGVTVLIDSTSLDFLKGAEIDFVDDLIGASFKVNNPNATSSCGCGTSFSV